MPVRNWAIGSTAPFALAAAPSYATVELQHIAAATVALDFTFICLFGGNNAGLKLVGFIILAAGGWGTPRAAAGSLLGRVL